MTDPAGIQSQIRQREANETTFREIHDTIFPADVRDTELLIGRLRIAELDGTSEAREVRIWSISPLGLEVLDTNNQNLKAGDKCVVELRLGRQTTSLSTVVVGSDLSTAGSVIYGLRITASEPTTTPAGNRRQFTRWICSSQFHPVAVGPNPVAFNDFLYFSIRDISSAGMRAHTSLRNKFIVPGMRLELQVSFPMTGHAVINVTVARTSLTAVNGKDFLEVGLSFSDLSNRTAELIGQYLIQFSNAQSVDEIREQGLNAVSLVKATTFSYVKTEKDFQDALELRWLANKAVKKIPSQTSIYEMADAYDAKSRILTAKRNGKTIGTLRITFFEQGESLESEKYVRLPSEFPRRDELIECSRAATHPQFRNAELWYTLIQQASITALRAKRWFAVVSTTEELIKMYESLGFRRTGLTYVHPLYPAETQHVMHVGLVDVLRANSVNFLPWHLVWKPVADYALKHDVISEDELKTTKTSCYRALGPLAGLMTSISSRRKTHFKRTKKTDRE